MSPSPHPVAALTGAAPCFGFDLTRPCTAVGFKTVDPVDPRLSGAARGVA